MLDLDFETISTALWKIPLPNVDCIVGIATGGIVPASLLAHQLRRPFYRLTINYRAPDNTPQRPVPELLQPVPRLPENARILLVDDVSVSGKTLQLAKELLPGYQIVTFTLKGNADIVVFPEIAECVAWPWKV
jgi:uncharacterized protein